MGHQGTRGTMSDQHCGRPAFANHMIQACHPILALRRIPITLEHTLTRWVQALPVTLPVIRAGVSEARQNKEGMLVVHSL